MRKVALLFCVFGTLSLQSLCTAAPVDFLIEQFYINDTRILDLSGTYNFPEAGAPNSSSITVVQAQDGTIAGTITITGANAPAAPFTIAGYYMPDKYNKVSGLTFVLTGTNPDKSWSARITGDFIVSPAPGHFETRVELFGPNHAQSLVHNLYPVDNGRGMLIYAPHQLPDSTFSWFVSGPNFAFDGGTCFCTRGVGPSLVKPRATNIAGKFKCIAGGTTQAPTMIPAPSPAKSTLKWGRLKLTIPQNKFSVPTLDPI